MIKNSNDNSNCSQFFNIDLKIIPSYFDNNQKNQKCIGEFIA